MKVKRGFTLVELLVVIAIIALLLSILMPAMQKVREQSRSLVCKANMRQLGMGMQLYAESNNGNSMDMKFLVVGEYWISQLMPYLGKASGQYDAKQKLKVGICPSTKMTDPTDVNMNIKGTANQAWRYTGAEGSYGLNHWLIPGYYVDDPARNWSKKYSTVPSSVPSFGDCNWVGGWPLETDKAPREGGYTLANGKDPFVGADQMGRYCINRHAMTVNVCIVGGNVEKIPLNKLWTLKWHKGYLPVDIGIIK
jgi:prepilin-type N-terminal cleavage/methylation domain-containing protein